jgi:putative membrane protein
MLARVRPLTRPHAALAVFSLVIVVTHLPGFYDATLVHPLLHDGEHAAYLLAGLLLFTPLLDADPAAAMRLGGVGRLIYLIAATPAMALVGAYLNGSTRLVYASYRVGASSLGVSAVLDQRRAGAIMWVGGGLVLVAVGLTSALVAMLAEERRFSAREARADRAEHALAVEGRR